MVDVPSSAQEAEWSILHQSYLRLKSCNRPVWVTSAQPQRKCIMGNPKGSDTQWSWVQPRVYFNSFSRSLIRFYYLFSSHCLRFLIPSFTMLQIPRKWASIFNDAVPPLFHFNSFYLIWIRMPFLPLFLSVILCKPYLSSNCLPMLSFFHYRHLTYFAVVLWCSNPS